MTRLPTPTHVLDRRSGDPVTRHVRLLYRLEGDQARRSAVVCGTTGAVADRVSEEWRIPGTRVHVVPNLVDIEEVRRAGRGPVAEGLPDRFVVFVGRIEVNKGVETLAAALPDGLSAVPDLHAVIVGGVHSRCGSGVLLHRVRGTVGPVSERVHFVGAHCRGRALAIVARAELAVVPSLWESFGLVCVEALAFGRPVIASRAGGLPDVLGEEGAGWLVPAGDAPALATEPIRRVSDAEGLRRASRSAERRAVSIGEGTVVPRVIELLTRAAGSSNRSIA